MPVVSPLQKLLLSQNEQGAVHTQTKYNLLTFLRFPLWFSDFCIPTVEFIC